MHWLDGGVLCEEAKRYVGNFLSVHRVRPRNDDEDDANSDDVVSDEDLELTAEDLEEALTSRIGGREKTKGEATDEAEDEGTHRANSAAGMALKDSWRSQSSRVKPVPVNKVAETLKSLCMHCAAIFQRCTRKLVGVRGLELTLHDLRITAPVPTNQPVLKGGKFPFC